MVHRIDWHRTVESIFKKALGINDSFNSLINTARFLFEA